MIKRDLIWTPFLFLLYRDVKRFYKVKIQTVLMPLVTYSLYLIIFGVSLGKVINIHESFTYLEFIIPGLITLGAMNNAFENGSSSLFTMKITGEIIDLKSTALHPQQIIWAMTLSGLFRGVTVGLLTLGLGEVFHYFHQGAWLPIHNLPFLFVFILVGGAVFAKIGLSVGIWSRSFDQIGAVRGFVILPLIYFGGVFFDLDKLAPFWQTASLLNPLFYFVNGIRWSVLGEADISPERAFTMVLMSLVLAHFIAWFFMKKGSFARAA
ncbi:MAG: ABC transporter permease [Bdellovibrionales bacterium]|nr:ABC transporter permease [Bdellovibrionales bacterium]